MNAKQLVEFAADLRLDVPGAKLALLVAVEGFESAEITRLRAEVDALKRTHDEAMKRSHEVTQEMARQFETEVEALRAERQVLNSAIVAAKSETAEFAEVAINAQNEVEALKAGNYKLTDVLLRNGFRRCHNIFCNCGSWHYEGGYRARMDEITEALAEAGYPLSNENGNTPLRALGELVAEVEALRADAERYRWLRNKAGRGAAGSIFDNFNGSAVDECIDAARAAQGDKP